jgi:Flp pilus assembly protein TadB
VNWLRDLFGILWAVAGLASILFAVAALSIQRNQRSEQSINAKFDDELGEIYDQIQKDSAGAKYYDQKWREIHTERRRSALSTDEAFRLRSACRFWMVATGCALAAVVMLWLIGGHVGS